MTIRMRSHSIPVSGDDTLHAVELWPDDHLLPLESLVFSHGAGGSHVNWYQQATYFSTTHRVVLWDHRGFGQSTNRAGLASPEVAASDLGKVITTIAPSDAHVIAQSMGGWAALALAVDRPELFRSLVLTDTCAGILSEATIANLRQFMVDSQAGADEFFGSRAVSEEFAKTNPVRAALYNLLSKANPSTYPTAVNDLIIHPFSGDLTRLTAIPVLAIVGANDQIFPPDDVKRLLACIPDITFLVIDGCGHSPYIESPNEFNKALTDFISTPR